MENEVELFIPRKFESYDDNNNGVLDREEFCKALKNMIRELSEDETEEELDAIVKEATEKFDLNQNGTIEFDEFHQLMKFLIEEKGLSID